MAEESHSVNITGLNFPIQAQLPTNSLLTAKPRTSVSTVQFELSGMSVYMTFPLILVAVWRYVSLDARVRFLNQPS